MPDDSLAADIVAARAGCEVALSRLFAACRSYLLTVANRTLPQELQAKIGGSDVVQETMLQIHENFSRFQGGSEGELLAWLRGALLNNVKDVTRRYRDTQRRRAPRDLARRVPERCGPRTPRGCRSRFTRQPGGGDRRGRTLERGAGSLA